MARTPASPVDAKVPASRSADPVPVSASAVAPIQRDDAEDGGGGLLGWVTNAWNDVKRGATAAVTAVGSTVTGGIEGLGKVLESASSTVASDWDGLKKAAGSLLESAERSGSGLVSGIVGHLKSAGSALV